MRKRGERSSAARSAGRMGARTNQRYPLRKIVRTVFDPEAGARFGPTLLAAREELECGHLVRLKRDIFGYTNATRRRCRQCGARTDGGPN